MDRRWVGTDAGRCWSSPRVGSYRARARRIKTRGLVLEEGLVVHGSGSTIRIVVLARVVKETGRGMMMMMYDRVDVLS